MEPNRSLPSSQEPVNEPYPEPAESSNILFIYDPF
jgi:hypothetical protein